MAFRITPGHLAQAVAWTMFGKPWQKNGHDPKFQHDSLTDGPLVEKTVQFPLCSRHLVTLTMDQYIDLHFAPINGMLKEIEFERGGKDQVLFYLPSSPRCQNETTGESFAWKESVTDPKHGHVVCWEYYSFVENVIYVFVRIAYRIRHVAEKTESIENLMEYALAEAA